MNEEIYESYLQAGKIAADAREYGRSLVKPGVKLVEVAERVEQRIRDQGAGIAFPVNLSINEIAAHYSPYHKDTLFFHKGDVVKVDVGAHVNGYIADTALTVEIDSHTYSAMINAAEAALNRAINMIHAGIDFAVVGTAIEEEINTHGFRAIDNLTGHSLEQYDLHSGLSVPNVANWYRHDKPGVDAAVAIEPFATNGAGHVVSGDGSNIFHYAQSVSSKLIRDHSTRVLLEKIKSEFGNLPFAQRWCARLNPRCDRLLRRLMLLKNIRQYPQLIEANKGVVTQWEHTVIIHETDCEVIT